MLNGNRPVAVEPLAPSPQCSEQSPPPPPLPGDYTDTSSQLATTAGGNEGKEGGGEGVGGSVFANSVEQLEVLCI